MRTTLDIEDEAYYLAKAIARDKDQSLGRTISELILARPATKHKIIFENGFPTVSLGRPISSEEVKSLIEED